MAELIDRALTRPDEDNLARVKQEVEELTSAFPLYATKTARRPSAERAGPRRHRRVPEESPVNDLQFADDVMARIRARGGRYHERGYLFVLGTIEFLQTASRFGAM